MPVGGNELNCINNVLRPKSFFEIIVDLHKVVRNNTKISPVCLHASPLGRSRRTTAQHHSQDTDVDTDTEDRVHFHHPGISHAAYS